MQTIDQIKAAALAEIDRRGDELIGVAKTILDNPEPGFREFKTARTVAEAFQRFGIPYKDGIGITGMRGDLRGGRSGGPTVAVMGELDSLKVLGHPPRGSRNVGGARLRSSLPDWDDAGRGGGAAGGRRDGVAGGKRRAHGGSRRRIHRGRVPRRPAARGQAGVHRRQAGVHTARRTGRR